ncbi:MAG: AAA family ATPase [Aurantimonas coralicida]
MFDIKKAVLVTGVFGTGKTTLVREIAAYATRIGLTVNVGTEVSRISPFPLNREQSDLGTRWLILRQLLTESEASVGNADVFLADRGVIDILAHLKETEVRSGKISATFGLFLEAMKASVFSYDVIFRTHPAEAYPPEADGIRSSSLAYQAEMDGFHDMAIEMLGVKYVSLPDGLDLRMEKVADYLEGVDKM